MPPISDIGLVNKVPINNEALSFSAYLCPRTGENLVFVSLDGRDLALIAVLCAAWIVHKAPSSLHCIDKPT